MKPFKPEHYFRAALERNQQAFVLYNQGTSYALAMFAAGLAVECLLRAFKGRHTTEFDEKHHLPRLLENSGLLRITCADFKSKGLGEEQLLRYQRLIELELNEVYLLWSNDYRFASEDRLKSHLKNRPGFRKGVRGDILKACAIRLVNASQKLVNRGSLLWRLL